MPREPSMARYEPARQNDWLKEGLPSREALPVWHTASDGLGAPYAVGVLVQEAHSVLAEASTASAGSSSAADSPEASMALAGSSSADSAEASTVVADISSCVMMRFPFLPT